MDPCTAFGSCLRTHPIFLPYSYPINGFVHENVPSCLCHAHRWPRAFRITRDGRVSGHAASPYLPQYVPQKASSISGSSGSSSRLRSDPLTGRDQGRVPMSLHTSLGANLVSLARLHTFMMDAGAAVVVSNSIVLPARVTCFKRLPLAAVRNGHWSQQSFRYGVSGIGVFTNEFL